MSKSFGNMRPVLEHLVRGEGGLAGEIADLRHDVDKAFGTLEAPGVGGSGVLCAQNIVDPVAAAPAGLEVATAPTAAGRLVTAFLAPGAAALAANARNVTFTVAGTDTAAPLSALVTGTDIDGKALTETVPLGAAAGLYPGVKCFKTVTSVQYVATAVPITDCTVSIGFGDVFGLASKILDMAGVPGLIQEYEDGAKVATGTFATATASPPYGSYEPATAPDGSVPYALLFVRDLS